MEAGPQTGGAWEVLWHRQTSLGFGMTSQKLVTKQSFHPSPRKQQQFEKQLVSGAASIQVKDALQG
jgi:hypothetical protein